MGVKGIIGEMGEKLLELGQDVGQKTKTQVAGGIAQSAKKQVLGQNPQGSQQIPRVDGGKKDTSVVKPQDLGREQFAQMLGETKSIAPKDLQAVKESSAVKTSQELATIQQKIRNYQEIQRAIETYRAKKRQEVREDVAGKPGQAATPEEQAEKMDKAKKEEEKAKKKKTLSASVSQFLGSHEQGKFAVG
jgi:hypothetical protein